MRFKLTASARKHDIKTQKVILTIAVLIITTLTAIVIIDSDNYDATNPSITLDHSSLKLRPNGSSGSVEATISGDFSGTASITLSSDNTAVATVPSSASISESKATITVTPKEDGTATITVKLKDGNTVKDTKTIDVTVKVDVSNVVIVNSDGSTIPNKKLTMNTGGEKTVKAKVTPSDATNPAVIWSSNKSDIASIDSNGKIKGIKEGTAIIKVSSVDNPLKTYEITVEVKDVHITSVTLDPLITSVKMRHQITLTATILPADATNKNVTISIDGTNLIKKVSQTASGNKVTIVLEGIPGDKEGTATITVTTEDQKKTASSTVKVERITVTGVELTEETEEIEVDDELELTYKVTPPDATNPKVTWTSSNSSVATVNEDGVVKAVSPGTATITVTTVEGNFTDTCEITVPKTITIIGFVDASGNVLGTDDLIKSIDKTAARSLYPVLALVDITGNIVNMSSDIVRALQKAKGGSMDISTPLGEAYFDENAIDRVDVTGKTAGITFTQIPSETYPKFGECYVYDISMTKDGAKVPTNFGSCGPKIGIYHELGETEDVSKLKVAFVYGDGDAIMLRNYAYVEDEDNSAVVFEPPHMSTFMYMFHDSEYISTDSFDVVFVALFLVLVLALGGGVAFLEFHPMASEKFMNLFDNPNKPPKRPRFPGRSRKNEYDDYYNNDYYR